MKIFDVTLGTTKGTKERLTLFSKATVQRYLPPEIHFWMFQTSLVPLNIKRVTSCASAAMIPMERKVLIQLKKKSVDFNLKTDLNDITFLNLFFSAFWEERVENVLLYIKRTCIIFAQR